MSDARLGDPEDQQAQESLTPRKRGLFRRGEDGLTTLEWLLIVAAVAGLAALAVVLVTNVVDDTAEQIGGSSARKTAAQVAASNVTQNAHDAPTADTEVVTASLWNALMSDYQKKCNRLRITYGDVKPKLTVTWTVADHDAASNNLVAWQAALDGENEGCVVS